MPPKLGHYHCVAHSVGSRGCLLFFSAGGSPIVKEKVKFTEKESAAKFLAVVPLLINQWLEKTIKLHSDWEMNQLVLWRIQEGKFESLGLCCLHFAALVFQCVWVIGHKKRKYYWGGRLMVISICSQRKISICSKLINEDDDYNNCWLNGSLHFCISTCYLLRFGY